MRVALCALVLVALASAASAQVYQAQPNAVLQIQRANLLDGVWRAGGLGDLTLTTRPNEVLVGSLAGQPCHGQYRGNAFAILCMSPDRGPYLISGQAREEPPIANIARARIVAHQIHISYLSSRGHVEEIATLSATRQ